MSGTDQAEGQAEELGAAAQEKVGEVSDHPQPPAEREGDQAAGNAREAIADAKDALHDVTKDH